MIKSILVILVALVCASPAMADTTTYGAEQRPTNAQGQPIGPWVSLPAQAVGPTNGPFAKVRSLASAQGCATVRAWVKRTSPVGLFLWQYFHYAYFCWKYPNVVNVSRWTDYLTGNGWRSDSQWSSVGLFYSWCCGAPRSGHTRWFRRHFYMSIPIYGLFQEASPQITLKVTGGGASFAQFAGT